MDIDVERLRLMRHYQVTKIHIVGVSEEEERERADNMFFFKKYYGWGLPFWLSGKEPSWQHRRRGLNP